MMPTRNGLRSILWIVFSIIGMQNIALAEEKIMQENDASLRALSVSSGEMVPQFSPNRTRVSVRVPHAITKVEIAAAATDPQASIRFNGAEKQTGQITTSVALKAGRNLFPVVTIARDGETTKTTVVKVLRDYPTPNWTQKVKQGPFPARDSAGELVFENQMWLLGGYLPKVSGDIWSTPDGTNWQKTGELPSESGINIPANFVFRGKMWVADNLGVLYASSDGKSWEKINAAPPWAGRYAVGSAVFKNRMWVFGGLKSGKLFNDVWSSPDGIQWKQETASASWSPRQLFGNVVVKDDKLWIVGGGITNYEPFRAYRDVWNSSDGVNWEKVSEQAPWPARIWSSCVVYRDRIFLLGGFRAQPQWENLSDVWYSSDGKNWHQLQTETNPSARHEHSPYVFDGKLWVVAGNSWPLLNDVWSLEIPGLTFLSQPVIEDYVGAEYSYHARADFGASAKVVRYRLAKAPQWLKLNEQTGLVQGIAPAAGDYEIALEAYTPNGETARQNFVLHIENL
jgi:hypothetical protein